MSANSQALLQVDGLSVEMDVPAGLLHAVSDVSFEVGSGRTFCLVGESGCGKTMTSLALMQLLPRKARLSARRILFEGRDLARMSPREVAQLRGDRMGMIFQDPMTALNPVYTVGDQLAEVYVRHRRASRGQARDRAVELLERVGIMSAGQRLAQYPHQLSGGLRQRVMIAMTLMCEPSLVIADEPTTALDVTVQVQILQLLKKLQAEMGMAIILITHNLGVVARMADDVAVMYGGRIVESGSPTQVFGRASHPYTRGLMACMPTRGEAGPGQRLGSIPGTVPSMVGEHQGCAFRNRCAHAGDACGHGVIAMRDAGGGHHYRCVLAAGAGSGRHAVQEALQ